VGILSGSYHEISKKARGREAAAKAEEEGRKSGMAISRRKESEERHSGSFENRRTISYEATKT